MTIKSTNGTWTWSRCGSLAAIGTTGDADLISLADNKVTIKGSLDTDGYICGGH